MNRELYTVTPAGDGAPKPWALRRDSDVLGYFDHQEDAADAGRTVARYRLKVLGKLGELQVHGRNGQIRAKDTFGDDPPETKG